MKRDEKLLVKVYEEVKMNLRELAKLEKEVTRHINSYPNPDLKKIMKPSSYKELTKSHNHQTQVLIKLGFINLEDKEEVLNQFYSRSQHLIEKMTKMAMNLVPSSYKANICNAYEHFEAPIAQITGPGYIHISFHTQSDDKYCASPYGYVFKNNIKFGRILKDGSIKSGKSGRFGNLVYD